ncbi:unnamed protein product [Clonostachys rhizophaga]|uniref:Peptidase M20 dimerisation domain-containing protein n=1 Tax=Clonostachys rhizophaga TaxID=160324 RepID=A0A9N9W0R9_9HYPO|nr:unnamed protein product [Clonostachys rhizophaga]
MASKSLFKLSSIAFGLLACLRNAHGAALESRGPHDDFEQASWPSQRCKLTGPIYPENDELPSAEDLFGGPSAFAKQLDRHREIVKVDSICYDDLGPIGDDKRWESFDKLQEVLERLYPLMHDEDKVQFEVVNTYGLVYTFHGQNEDLAPVLLTAHQDVVPVGDEADWTYPPFSAEYDEETDWMWGRGVADDKNRLTALMSVFEELLAVDWQPQRGFVLALGFDEECSGLRGAWNINDALIDKYGQDAFGAIIDEGGLGIIDLDFGRDPPVRYALPAVTEKGFVNIWLDLQVKGGHSSIPTPHTDIGIMSEIVVALEENPFSPKVEWNSPVHKSLQCLARYSPNAFPSITHLVDHGNLYKLAEVVSSLDLAAAALVQTTQAVNIIYGGDKINSLPELTTVGINYRVAPQDSVLAIQHNIVKYASSVIEKFGLDLNAYEGDDEYHHYAASLGGGHHHRKPRRGIDYEGTLTIRAEKKFNGAPVSPTDDEAWRIFAGTIEATFKEPGLTVVPTGVIMTGNTDSKHYLELSRNVYRWNPHPAFDIENIHAVDERLKMSAHIGIAKFYYNLIRNFDEAEDLLKPSHKQKQQQQQQEL